MFCTNCGIQLTENDRFCSQCGNPAGPGLTPASPYSERRLRLPLEGKKIAGVCAGFARYFGVDVTLMRIAWLVAALCTGIGFIAYVIAWLLMPKEQPALVVQTNAIVRQAPVG